MMSYSTWVNSKPTTNVFPSRIADQTQHKLSRTRNEKIQGGKSVQSRRKIEKRTTRTLFIKRAGYSSNRGVVERGFALPLE